MDRSIKQRLTKLIWYGGVLWKLESIRRPTKYDTFLILRRDIKDQAHEGDITPIEIACIDAYNDEFHPNTKAVQKLYKERKALLKKLRDVDDKLRDTWCLLFDWDRKVI